MKYVYFLNVILQPVLTMQVIVTALQFLVELQYVAQVNRSNYFYYICDEFTLVRQRCKLTLFIRKAYELYLVFF